MWEHNLPKIPDLGMPVFQLGDWEVTCWRAERDAIEVKYVKVGPLDNETKLEEVLHGLRLLDGGKPLEITWIPPRGLPRTTMGK